MSQLSVVSCPDLVIPSGTNVSNIMVCNKVYDDAVALQMYSDAALEANTYIIQVSNDHAVVAGGTWYTYQEGGTTPVDRGCPAAGKSGTYYDLTGVQAFRIKNNTGNVAADRTIKLDKIVRS